MCLLEYIALVSSWCWYFHH